MPQIELSPVERVASVSPSEFQERFMEPGRPVVLRELASSWPALTRWTPEFFQEVHGDKQVKVYDASFARPGAKYMSSLRTIPLRDYIEEVIHRSGDLRMFLYNMIREAPELRDDIRIPDLSEGFSERFVFMFFGCRGSVTPIHYDIDMAHVFHTPIHGRKRVVLFSPEESTRLYRHPMTVRSYVDVDDPDFERFPVLAEARGWEVVLEAGETLFIPGGFWHHIVYEEGGYAVSLRCRHQSLSKRMEGYLSLLVASPADRLLNKLLGRRWFRIKEGWADRRAQRSA